MISRDIRRMKNIKQFYFLIFLLIARTTWAQELPEYEWWSLPLMNKPTLIQSVPLFHGYTVGWRPKGMHSNQQLVDAIDFNSAIGLMPSYEWFRHLQFNGQTISFDKEYSEKTLLRNANTPYVQYALHNHISKNTSMFQLKTEQTFRRWDWGINGVLLKKWNNQDWLGPIEQQGIQGYLSHSNTNRWRWTIQYSANHQFRTVASATAKEVYDLVKTNEYNPNWGWYHGQMLFVNNRNLQSHVLQMTIEKKFSPLHWMRWSVASVLMQNDRQSLTWNQTRDPRPDYYKYLPSYQKDSAAYNQLYDYLSSHPQKLQFDFDQMEKINMQSKTKQSRYVIDKNNQWGYQQRIAFEWHFENQYHLSLHNRMQWGWDKSLNSHQLVDLLGGTIYPNQLQWINEGESGNDFQANINDTSMLHVGSVCGSNYTLL